MMDDLEKCFYMIVGEPLKKCSKKMCFFGSIIPKYTAVLSGYTILK